MRPQPPVYVDPTSRAKWAVRTSFGAAMLWPFMLFIVYLDPDSEAFVGFSSLPGGAWGYYAFVVVIFVFLLLLAASYVTYFRWLHRVATNARVFAGPELQISPWGAILWHFVPIANLIKPYQNLGTVWRASLDPAQHWRVALPGLFFFWWGICALGLVTDVISRRFDYSIFSLEEALLIDVGFTALAILELVLTIRVVRRLTPLQVAQHSAEVFK